MLEFRGHGSGIAQAFALEQVARPEQVATDSPGWLAGPIEQSLKT